MRSKKQLSFGTKDFSPFSWKGELYQKRLIILLSALFVAAISGIWVYGFKPDIFEARSTIMPKAGPGQNPLAALAGQLSNIPAIGSVVSSATNLGELQQYQVFLKSYYMAQQALQVPKMRELLQQELEFRDDAAGRKEAVDYMASHFRLQIDGPALYLSFRSSHKEIAKTALESFHLALQEFLNGRVVTQSRNTELFVEGRLKELNRELQDMEQELAGLRTGSLRPENPRRSLQAEIIWREREYLRLGKLAELLGQQYELSRIEAKRDDPMFVTIDPPHLEDKPVSPQRRVVLVLGFFLGAFMAMVVILARRKWRDLQNAQV